MILGLFDPDERRAVRQAVVIAALSAVVTKVVEYGYDEAKAAIARWREARKAKEDPK